ncbi:MAG: putative ABC transporter ATP-binding protein [Candidatus Heimdallarchaeota archaeon LC_3]|nr:MAG: putative ABC transporter ATP-binding protein [Candidatus Heimdallarchaeota archaeon LC_3]
MSEQDVVNLIAVSKRYKSGDEIIHAVHNISLDIKKSEFVVIMGPSGSGKSTLLNVIAGLTNLTEGKIQINDKSLQNLSENQKAYLRRKEMGIIFQFYNLHEGLTAIENIELPMLIAGVPLKERRKRSMVLLKDVDMEKRAFHRPYELSGGEKQRIGIARALANNPPLLLADEPTGDLDFENGKKILELLIKLNQTKGITVIMVTHDSTLIQKGFRLIRLDDGKINFDAIIDDPESVIDDFTPLISDN